MNWEDFAGVIGILMAVVFSRAVACLIEIKREWWRRLLLLTGSWFLVFVIIYVGDIFNMPPAMAFFLFACYIAGKGSKLKRLTIGLMFASIMLSFNGLADNCIGCFYINEHERYFHIRYMLWRAGFVMLLYLGVRGHRADRDFELAPQLWRLLLMLCMPPFGILVALVLCVSPFISTKANIVSYSVLFLMAIFAFVGIFRAMVILEKQQKMERENILAAHNKKYYEVMEQQQFEIRRLKHDLANHLQILLTLPAQEKDDYIQKMIENPAFEKVLSYCADATVNAVLTAKESLMRQKNVSFYCKIDIPQTLPFEKPDICALFANALDNAVEACEVLGTEKGQVELTARAAKGILALEVKNPCRDTECYRDADGHFPETTKTDKTNHGYGLRSIEEVVKKYGGNIEITQAEGRFVLFCFIPIA